MWTQARSQILGGGRGKGKEEEEEEEIIFLSASTRAHTTKVNQSVRVLPRSVLKWSRLSGALRDCHCCSVSLYNWKSAPPTLPDLVQEEQ